MRETGPVRKELSGEEAAPYIGFARTVLGQLKDHMALGGLEQGTWTKRLPDGAIVTVRSIFGQDTINISKPVPVAEAQVEPSFTPPHEVVEAPEVPVKVPDDEAAFDSFVAAGHVGNLSLRYAFLWRSPSSPVDLGFLPGLLCNTVYDISENGRAVVGAANGGGDSHAWIWTRDTGMVDLGTRRIATSVSRDGSVVVGRGESSSDTIWVWTQADGMVDIAPAASDPKVSPNGRFITALTSGQIAAVWERSSLARTDIPGPGTSSYTREYVPNSTLEADWNIPQNVDDRGRVTGKTTHVAVSTYYTATTFWDQGGGVPGGFTSGVEGERAYYYQSESPNPTPVFSYDLESGVYEVVGGLGEAVAAADDRYTVVGNEVQATLTDIITMGNEVPPNALSRVATYGIYTSPNVPYGWFWSRHGGKRSLGPDVACKDISENAAVIVGSRSAAGVNVPTYWRLGTSVRDFAVPAYATGDGVATCVAAWRTEMSTAQQ